MTDKTMPTLRGQWLGQKLRELRENADLTLKKAAEYLERDPSTLARFESGEYPIRRADLIALLGFYPLPDPQVRETLLALREDVWRTEWWEGHSDDVDRTFPDLIWLESRAREIRTFEQVYVEGLLQTSDYARAAIEAGEDDLAPERIERLVELRMARQRVLTGERAPRLRTIIDETVLRRPVGGPAVMRPQLEHLVERAAWPNVEVRVLPLSVGAHASYAGSFRLHTLPEPFPRVAYAETPAGSIYVEPPLAGRFAWTYDRLSDSALSCEESADLISAIVREHDG